MGEPRNEPPEQPVKYSTNNERSRDQRYLTPHDQNNRYDGEKRLQRTRGNANQHEHKPPHEHDSSPSSATESSSFCISRDTADDLDSGRIISSKALRISAGTSTETCRLYLSDPTSRLLTGGSGARSSGSGYLRQRRKELFGRRDNFQCLSPQHRRLDSTKIASSQRGSDTTPGHKHGVFRRDSLRGMVWNIDGDLLRCPKDPPKHSQPGDGVALLIHSALVRLFAVDIRPRLEDSRHHTS
jgi:hypothetical protein